MAYLSYRAWNGKPVGRRTTFDGSIFSAGTVARRVIIVGCQLKDEFLKMAAFTELTECLGPN